MNKKYGANKFITNLSSEEKEVDSKKETKTKSKSMTKYYRLALTEESHNYIYLMAEHEEISMAKYINKLIDKDKNRNESTYEKLHSIEELKKKI